MLLALGFLALCGALLPSSCSSGGSETVRTANRGTDPSTDSADQAAAPELVLKGEQAGANDEPEARANDEPEARTNDEPEARTNDEPEARDSDAREQPAPSDEKTKDSVANGADLPGYGKLSGTTDESKATEKHGGEDVEPTQPTQRALLDAFAGIEHTEILLVPFSATEFDEFGWSVATDGQTIVVGAPLHDEMGPESGAAYVFEQIGDRWREAARLLPDDGEASGWFGRWVDIDGDTIVIGAPLMDVKGEDDDAGAAFVFVRAGQGWAQQAKLVAPDAGAGDQFGWSVAISGDTLAISAIADDFGGVDSGSIYIFRRSGETWEQEAWFLAGDPGVADMMGGDIALDGDTLIAGATGDDVGGTESGAAYVFRRDGTTWSQTTKLLPPQVDEFDEFGRSVAVSGDRIVVAAPFDDDAGRDAGAVYLFRRVQGRWIQQTKLISADLVEGDWFGWGVAIDEQTLIVGAPHDTDPDLGIARTGMAYVFQQVGNEWVQAAALQSEHQESAGASADFGWIPAIDGSVIVIGSWLADTKAGEDSGAASIFRIGVPGATD